MTRSQSRESWAVGTVLLAVALAACGGEDGQAVDAGRASDGQVSPDAGPVEANQLCMELTTLLCAAEQSCCSDSATRYADAAACFAATNPGCIADLQTVALDSQTGYDPQVARAELDELAGRVAACDATIGPWFVSHEGLLRIFQGTVASGGDCTPSGTADRAPVLSCQYPAVCRLTALPLTGTCGAARTQGDSCVTEIECVDDLRCDPPESLGGTCKSRGGNDTACGVDADCNSLVCEGSTCVAATVNRVYCFNQ